METRKLAMHQGRAHKLALEAGHSAAFYSCGEDGAVRHFDLREPGAASRKLLLCRASRHGQVRACRVHHSSSRCLGTGFWRPNGGPVTRAEREPPQEAIWGRVEIGALSPIKSCGY